MFLKCYTMSPFCSFDGSGYIELDKKLVSHSPDYRLEITLEFSTAATDGLILWQGQRRKEEEEDFWGGTMGDGQIVQADYMAVGSQYIDYTAIQ